MQYILGKRHLDKICEHQRLELMKSFVGCKQDENSIYIDYTDRNYLCMPKLNALRESQTHAISLFSGCGGLDIGVQMAGVRVISSLDFEQATVDTLRANPFFSLSEHNCEDIRNINGSFYSDCIRNNNPEKLIVVGGPPCQPFSKAGYWITNEKRKAFNDERNMVGEYLRVISEIKPNGFVLENVESILHPTNRPVVDFIENEITRMGYKYIRVLANAVDYGIPQKRKRVIYLASKNPIIGEPQKLDCIDSDRINVLDWIARFDDDINSEIEESTFGKTYDLELSEVPPGHNYIALSSRDGYPNPKFVANKRYWNFLLKLHPLLPSWTIAAQPGPWVGPFHWNNRRLRVKEIAAIQTFPMDYIFVGSRRTIQKQIGNAVPSILGQKFVEHLKKFL